MITSIVILALGLGVLWIARVISRDLDADRFEEWESKKQEYAARRKRVTRSTPTHNIEKNFL